MTATGLVVSSGTLPLMTKSWPSAQAASNRVLVEVWPMARTLDGAQGALFLAASASIAGIRSRFAGRMQGAVGLLRSAGKLEPMQLNAWGAPVPFVWIRKPMEFAPQATS